jgi:hypothetical protein
MENDDHGGKQDQLEEHSLPGTNQAGKGPASSGEEHQLAGRRRLRTSSRNTAFPAPTKPGKGLLINIPPPGGFARTSGRGPARIP